MTEFDFITALEAAGFEPYPNFLSRGIMIRGEQKILFTGERACFYQSVEWLSFEEVLECLGIEVPKCAATSERQRAFSAYLDALEAELAGTVDYESALRAVREDFARRGPK